MSSAVPGRVGRRRSAICASGIAVRRGAAVAVSAIDVLDLPSGAPALSGPFEYAVGTAPAPNDSARVGAVANTDGVSDDTVAGVAPAEQSLRTRADPSCSSWLAWSRGWRPRRCWSHCAFG